MGSLPTPLHDLIGHQEHTKPNLACCQHHYWSAVQQPTWQEDQGMDLNSALPNT